MEQEQTRTSSTRNHTRSTTTPFLLQLNSSWGSCHVTSLFQLLVPPENTMILVYLVGIDLLREKKLERSWILFSFFLLISYMFLSFRFLSFTLCLINVDKAKHMIYYYEIVIGSCIIFWIARICNIARIKVCEPIILMIYTCSCYYNNNLTIWKSLWLVRKLTLNIISQGLICMCVCKRIDQIFKL